VHRRDGDAALQRAMAAAIAGAQSGDDDEEDEEDDDDDDDDDAPQLEGFSRIVSAELRQQHSHAVARSKSHIAIIRALGML